MMADITKEIIDKKRKEIIEIINNMLEKVCYKDFDLSNNSHLVDLIIRFEGETMIIKKDKESLVRKYLEYKRCLDDIYLVLDSLES